MWCPKCGYINEENALVCNLCHEILKKEYKESSALKEEKIKKSNWKKWFPSSDIYLLLLIFVGLLWVWDYYNSWLQDNREFYKKFEPKNNTDYLQGEDKNTNKNVPKEISPEKFFLNTCESDHFIIYGERYGVAQQLIRIIENYVTANNIFSDLGIGSPDFWMKEKIVICIYSSPEKYEEITGQSALTKSYSEAEKRRIHIYQKGNMIPPGVLAHELTHLILDDFLKPTSPPRFLTEGLAMYEEIKENHKYAYNYSKLLSIIHESPDDNLIPLDQLIQEDFSKEMSPEQLECWYAESLNLINYIINKYSQYKFYKLCAEIKGGINPTDALLEVCDKTDISALEKDWLSSLSEEAKSSGR